MLKRILSIAGRPGLFRLVNQGRNMLIVENIASGKRTPAYARDKVVSLGDISMYTVDGDVPLSEVLGKLKEVSGGNPVDIKPMDEAALRSYFATVLPNYDDERVYATDIRKLFGWYNQLLAAGITEFAEEEAEVAPQAGSEAGAE